MAGLVVYTFEMVWLKSLITAVLVLLSSAFGSGHFRELTGNAAATPAFGSSTTLGAVDYSLPSIQCEAPPSLDVMREIVNGEGTGMAYVCFEAQTSDAASEGGNVTFTAWYPTSRRKYKPLIKGNMYQIDFGDGSRGTLSYVGRTCGDLETFPCYERFRIEHRYTKSGTYAAGLFMESGGETLREVGVTVLGR